MPRDTMALRAYQAARTRLFEEQSARLASLIREERIARGLPADAAETKRLRRIEKLEAELAKLRAEQNGAG